MHGLPRPVTSGSGRDSGHTSPLPRLSPPRVPLGSLWGRWVPGPRASCAAAGPGGRKPTLPVLLPATARRARSAAQALREGNRLFPAVRCPEWARAGGGGCPGHVGTHCSHRAGFSLGADARDGAGVSSWRTRDPQRPDFGHLRGCQRMSGSALQLPGVKVWLGRGRHVGVSVGLLRCVGAELF